MDFSPVWSNVNRWTSDLEAHGFSVDLVIAGAVLLLGWILALALRRLTESSLARLGRLISTAGPESALREEELRRTGRAVGRVVFWLVFALAVMAATERLGLPVVTAWLSGVANYLPRIMVAVLVLVAGVAGGRIAATGALRAAASSGVGEPQQLARVVELAVLAISALVAIEALGIDVTFLRSAILVVLAGMLLAGALAFGLGARDLVSDILACHYVQRLYEEGQVVRLEDGASAPLEGRILRVVPPCVVLETSDGELVVPGRRLTTSPTLVVRSRS